MTKLRAAVCSREVSFGPCKVISTFTVGPIWLDLAMSVDAAGLDLEFDTDCCPYVGSSSGRPDRMNWARTK